MSSKWNFSLPDFKSLSMIFVDQDGNFMENYDVFCTFSFSANCSAILKWQSAYRLKHQRAWKPTSGKPPGTLLTLSLHYIYAKINSVVSSKKPVHLRSLFGSFYPNVFDHARGWKVLGNYSLYVRIVAWKFNGLTFLNRTCWLASLIRYINTLWRILSVNPANA